MTDWSLKHFLKYHTLTRFLTHTLTHPPLLVYDLLWDSCSHSRHILVDDHYVMFFCVQGGAVLVEKDKDQQQSQQEDEAEKPGIDFATIDTNPRTWS